MSKEKGPITSEKSLSMSVSTKPASQGLLLRAHECYPVKVKYCEDTRPKNQPEASKQQHRDSRQVGPLSQPLEGLSSSHPPYHSVRWEGSSTPPTLWSLLKSLLALYHLPGHMKEGFALAVRRVD
eukprot:1158052-Pelagomonas_calceolata.AAC.1